MMDREEFDFFVGELLSSAVKEFKSTEEYRLLREKLDQMDIDCEYNLTDDARAFAVECFELILEAEGREEHYVYRKGLTDSVKILKWLGVLA